MKIVGFYSFKSGWDVVKTKYPSLLNEVRQAIKSVNLEEHKTKESKEKTMVGKNLYSPISLNKAFEGKFTELGWKKKRVKCEYPTRYYDKEYKPPHFNKVLFERWIF